MDNNVFGSSSKSCWFCRESQAKPSSQSQEEERRGAPTPASVPLDNAVWVRSWASQLLEFKNRFKITGVILMPNKGQKGASQLEGTQCYQSAGWGPFTLPR
jgi:hypothetical protein